MRDLTTILAASINEKDSAFAVKAAKKRYYEAIIRDHLNPILKERNAVIAWGNGTVGIFQSSSHPIILIDEEDKVFDYFEKIFERDGIDNPNLTALWILCQYLEPNTVLEGTDTSCYDPKLEE